jgi:hypothetical protein
MTYYIHTENNKIISCGECPMDEPFQSIEVTEEIYNNFIEDADRYIYQDGEIISNPDYEEIKANERKAEFESKFIQTIWGWYRKQPKGYANAPQSIDIIFNIVNASGGFTEQVADMMLFYQQPDFDNAEECTEEWLVEHQYKHEPCSIQEFMQFYIAFQTAWANDQYKSNGETLDVDTTQ